MKAALAVLIANTAPVAYGAAGTPITTAGNMVASGDASVALETAQHVAALVGYQAPSVCLVVPLLVLLILDGRKGLRDCWLHALVIGASFAIVQWWCSNHFAYELTDVCAALVSLGVSVIFLKFVKPKNVTKLVNALAWLLFMKLKQPISLLFAHGWLWFPTLSL